MSIHLDQAQYPWFCTIWLVLFLWGPKLLLNGKSFPILWSSWDNLAQMWRSLRNDKLGLIMTFEENLWHDKAILKRDGALGVQWPLGSALYRIVLGCSGVRAGPCDAGLTPAGLDGLVSTISKLGRIVSQQSWAAKEANRHRHQDQTYRVTMMVVAVVMMMMVVMMVVLVMMMGKRRRRENVKKQHQNNFLVCSASI